MVEVKDAAGRGRGSSSSGCMRLSIPIAEPRAVLGWGDEHRPSTALAILVETALGGAPKGHPGAPWVLSRPLARRGVGWVLNIEH